jgi:hypothetical protein
MDSFGQAFVIVAGGTMLPSQGVARLGDTG